MITTCGRCGSSFDDEIDLSVCPHQVANLPQYKPFAQPPMDVAIVDEVLNIELELLLYRQYDRMMPFQES